ncbi:hypothetical protein V8E54_000037 [Elaphomyces granulatus]
MIIIQECNSVAATALEEFYGTNDFDIVYIDDKVTFSENAKEGYSTQDIPLQEDLEDSQKEIVLLKLWMEFIYSERSRSGMCGLLPKMGKGNCECEGSRMAYPHWPPTSFEEATEQFDYCMQQRNTHRRYLANSWWIFFNKLGFQETADKRKMCEEKAELIESNCAYFQEELVKEENRITKRPNGWRCFEYCEPKIGRKHGYVFVFVNTIGIVALFTDGNIKGKREGSRMRREKDPMNTKNSDGIGKRK